MKNIFPFLFCLVSLNLCAQTFEITGKIIETDTRGPLEAATVYVENPADSTLVSYTISEADGEFMITGNTSANSLNLFVSFTGYQVHRQNLSLVNNRVINTGSITMNVADNELDEIQLTGGRAPITIKRDTLEFNAASFATRPDANLEELMKKLPGVEVDTQGNITVNGKPVSRILVNGKEFFGNDPKIATKNLPKEIIDKIQVTDTRTRSEEFTGKAGNPDDKTINITIQEDKNKGYFARATAGGGTDERYELSGIGNYFKDKMRISVLASSNNINSSGFSFDEVYDMMGRNARSISFNSSGGGGGSFGINGMNFGGGGGITKAETAGINFVNEWGKKLEVSGDYFFGRNDTETLTIIERENILPDSRYFYNSTNASNLVNDSHRANARIEFKPDTLTRISFSPRFNSNSGYSNRSSNAESLNANEELENSTVILDDELLESHTFSNRFDVIRRYGNRGAYSQVNFENRHQRQDNENYFFSESQFLGDNARTDVQDQFIDENQNENEYSIGATQRFVMATKLYLDASYNFSANSSTNTRSVYDKDDNGNYSDFNTLLSNDFESKSWKNIPYVGVNYEGVKWRVGSEIGLLNTTLENTNFLQENSFDNSYNNLYLRANVRYEMSRSKSIYFNYSSDAGVPSIRQLQPVINRSNPLNIVIGNPDLRPSYSQSIRGGYRNYDFAKRSGFFSYASVTFTDNSIVPVSTVDNFIRTTTYANLDGAVNANAGASFSKQYKKEKREISYRLGLNGNYDKNVGFSNTFLFNAERYTIRPSVNLTWAIEDYFSFIPGYSLAYTDYRYDLNPDRNESFSNHTVSLEATTFWPRNVVIGNDISYNYFGNMAPGFENSAFLWNLSVGYKFLDDNATLKLKVYDMLNENVSAQRMVGNDFIQDIQSLVLQQYAMLSFTYKISKFGGKDPNSGGPMRMMRM